jgi:hypothetical protein
MRWVVDPTEAAVEHNAVVPTEEDEIPGVAMKVTMEHNAVVLTEAAAKDGVDDGGGGLHAGDGIGVSGGGPSIGDGKEGGGGPDDCGGDGGVVYKVRLEVPPAPTEEMLAAEAEPWVGMAPPEEDPWMGFLKTFHATVQGTAGQQEVDDQGQPE